LHALGLDAPYVLKGQRLPHQLEKPTDVLAFFVCPEWAQYWATVLDIREELPLPEGALPLPGLLRHAVIPELLRQVTGEANPSYCLLSDEHMRGVTVLRYRGTELAEPDTSPWPALSRLLPSGGQHPWKPDLMEMPRHEPEDMDLYWHAEEALQAEAELRVGALLTAARKLNRTEEVRAPSRGRILFASYLLTILFFFFRIAM
jgi:hypothetical protein